MPNSELPSQSTIKNIAEAYKGHNSFVTLWSPPDLILCSQQSMMRLIHSSSDALPKPGRVHNCRSTGAASACQTTGRKWPHQLDFTFGARGSTTGSICIVPTELFVHTLSVFTWQDLWQSRLHPRQT